MERADRILVMGVAGAGKSTLGAALADTLGFAFRDADALHPPGNREKMAAGRPLTDADRAPWLAACRAAFGPGVVLACSALKASYRATLGSGHATVFLFASEDVLRSRLAARAGHFFPPSLLADQLAALEPPGPDALTLALDAGAPVPAQVARVCAWLRR